MVKKEDNKKKSGKVDVVRSNDEFSGQVGETLRDDTGRAIGFIDVNGVAKFTSENDIRAELGEGSAIRGQPGGGLTTGERRGAFQTASGSADLTKELEGKIAVQPDLEPGLTEPSRTLNRETTFGVGIGGIPGLSTPSAQQYQAQRLLLNPEGELQNVGIKVAAGAAVGVGLPILAKLFASGAMLKGSGLAATLLATSTTGLGLFVFGDSVFNFRGDEMRTHRELMQKVVEDGERLEAAARNGLPTTDTIATLQVMADEVTRGEARIKELGNFNLKYRFSKEYLSDQTKARSAREALIRRVTAVENIAATGTAAVDPEALLFNAEEFLANAEQ